MNQSEPEKMHAAQPWQLEALRVKAKVAAVRSRGVVPGDPASLLDPPIRSAEERTAQHLLALHVASNILQFYGKHTVSALVTNALRDIANGDCIGGESK